MKRILHIEDNVDITRMYRTYLGCLLDAPHVYEFNVRADNLAALLKKAEDENFQYAVVILDHDTEGPLKGLDALTQARELGFDMPIIFHSSTYLTPEEIDVKIKQQNARFIPKPEFREVTAHLKEILAD